MTPAVPFTPARLRLALFAAGLGLLGIAHAEDASRPFGLEFKATLESLDDRDLGTSHGGDLNGVGLDLRPWAFGQWGDWSAYSMGQAVAASDSVQTDTLQSDELTGGNRDNERQGDDSYLALREFWVDYAGLTRYPGEHLRLGRQRLRETSGTWRDSNIEALQWTFDTTLLTSNLGVAQRFSDYRTDLDELAPQDRDRTHLFGDLSVQWLPRQHAILTLHHIDERGGLRDPGEVIDASDKRSNGNLTWVGVEANGDGYDHRSPLPLNYWASFVSLFGDRNHLTSTAVDGERVASGKRSDQVDAYAIDLGLRWNIDDNWRAGIAYARGSGGEERQFQQTGLESNRSSFTGTRARVSRFGEAFRGELANLQDLTLFGAWQLHDDYDLSLVYHRFRRVDGDADIGNSAIRAPLVNDSNDLGQEFDLVMTRYFKPGLLPFGTDEGSQVRLRGGLFQPGGAYGRQADSRMHHAFIDFIWHL